MKKFILLGILLGASNVFAMSIDWSGGYRIEYTEIDRPSLAEAKERKAYGLNYLYLQPKILASDGVNVVGRFDLLSSEVPEYTDSQLGSIIGGRRTIGAANPGVTAENQPSSMARISQLYLNVNHEFGSLVAGRAPIEFGLGITHNAGLNPFDHWYDTRDMVSYKFIIDNISFMPAFARVSQKDFGQGVTLSDQMFVFEYNNKDIGAQAGLFHQTRRGSAESNDSAPALTAPGYPLNLATLESGWSTQTVNLFFGRQWKAFQFKLEASFLTGDTGYSRAGVPVKFNSYAVAAEMLMPSEGKFEFSGKLGVASGDDPATTNTLEGYQFDRNYDVAMLLFNHRMGQKDFLTTAITHPNAVGTNLSVGNSADDESIGNVIYLAPAMKYKWDDKFDIKSTLIYGQLMSNPFNSVDFKKDLGTELDIEVIYRPRERVTWSNQIGVLLPGQAWKDGATGLDNKLNYGFTTKAAITF